MSRVNVTNEQVAELRAQLPAELSKAATDSDISRFIRAQKGDIPSVRTVAQLAADQPRELSDVGGQLRRPATDMPGATAGDQAPDPYA